VPEKPQKRKELNGRITDAPTWEVIITTLVPSHSAIRLPPITDEMKAHDLARACKHTYPLALIEIDHNSIRSCV